jgi:transcriptional regulator with XRE-family HTH domain
MLLRDIRVLKRITQADLAILVGVTQAEISSIENGRYRPNEMKVKAICKAMDISDPSVIDWDDCDRRLRKAPKRTVFPASE